MDDDVGLAGKALLIKFTYHVVVGSITQIDHHLGHIIEVTVGLSQQGLDILPHTVCLPNDIFGIHHLTFIINRSGAGDKDMATVGIVDLGATLKAHAIVAGAVQMGGGIEIVYLILPDAGDGIVVHL